MSTAETSAGRPLAGKVALITGAGQGVGRGVAMALAEAGASVVLAGRTLAKCEAVGTEIRAGGGAAMAVACDVTSRADIERTVSDVIANFGGLNILVNNAQDTRRGPMLEHTDDDMAALWESGPLASFRLMQMCHPHLSGDGVIINMGSRAGVKPDPINCGPYAAVKEAIRALTRSVAWEWAGDGIRAFAVLPLAVSPALLDLQRDEPDAYERALSSIPMRRFGDPETDIGQVCVFLASPAAGYLTGITIPIDGGAAHIG